MPAQSPKQASQPQDVASRAEQQVIARALKKMVNGETLTKLETQALKRHEKDKEERLRWQYYRSIPQKHWKEMSGRQAKVINEQAQRYGIPFGGASIDLPSVVKALHDFLATHAVALAKDQEELMRGSGSPALEEYRQERAKLARLDRLEREDLLIPRDEAREAMGRIASIIRGSGDALGRQFGPGAVEILYEAMDDATREIERVFGEGGDGLSGEMNGHGAGHEGDDRDGQAPDAG